MSQLTYNQTVYTRASYQTSKLWTREFSSSFYKATTLLDEPIRTHIFNVYGLVRLADEIVDSWRPSDMATMLSALEKDIYKATKSGFSTNPIVHAYAITVVQFGIDQDLIKAFFASMKMDITKSKYTQTEFERYIYGSAQSVGLMCLAVFVNGDRQMYNRLKPAAMALGAGFQKVNFLRDLGSDEQELARYYFPKQNAKQITIKQYRAIIADINADFTTAQIGIVHLPKSSRYAVALALASYKLLLDKLSQQSLSDVYGARYRVGSLQKAQLLTKYRLVKMLGR